METVQLKSLTDEQVVAELQKALAPRIHCGTDVTMAYAKRVHVEFCGWEVALIADKMSLPQVYGVIKRSFDKSQRPGFFKRIWRKIRG